MLTIEPKSNANAVAEYCQIFDDTNLAVAPNENDSNIFLEKVTPALNSFAVNFSYSCVYQLKGGKGGGSGWIVIGKQK